MSFLARLGRWRLDDGPELAQADLATVTRIGLGGGGDVAQVRDLPATVAAAFGLSIGETISREDAMRVPTVRRARAVICGTIGAQPLVAHRDGEDVTSLRPWLTQPNPDTTLQYELTWTVDDLWFRGVSWWLIRDRDGQGFPRQTERLTPERLRVDLNAGRVYVDGTDRTGDLIRFDGPDEGLLTYAGSTLATSRLLDAAVRRLASGDVPLGVLKLAEGADELSTEPGSCGIPGDPRSEVDAVLDAWDDARRSRSWAYMNRAVDLQPFQKDAREQQLAEGRQQQRIDEANVCNVPPRIVNAPTASSMTYTNALAERADLVDTSLSSYIVAVEQRLSMGDVTPRGTTVRLDLTRYLSGDPLSALQAAQTAVELQAMTGDEVRTDVLGRAPLTAAQRAQLRPPTPSPAQPGTPPPPGGNPA